MVKYRDPIPKPVSLKELCYLLRVSRATVKRWRDNNGLPSEHVAWSSVPHYRLSSIMEWLEGSGRELYLDRLK